jgi:hypothetical protein
MSAGVAVGSVTVVTICNSLGLVFPPFSERFDALGSAQMSKDCVIDRIVDSSHESPFLIKLSPDKKLLE